MTSLTSKGSPLTVTKQNTLSISAMRKTSMDKDFVNQMKNSKKNQVRNLTVKTGLGQR